MKRSLMLFAAAGLLVLGQPAKAVETLKILSYLPPASVTVKEILTPFIQQVEAATKGEIKFQTYWGGSLGRDPEKQYKLLVDGIGDVVWMSNYLQGGQFPDEELPPHVVHPDALLDVLAVLQGGLGRRQGQGVHVERLPHPLHGRRHLGMSDPVAHPQAG